MHALRWNKAVLLIACAGSLLRIQDTANAQAARENSPALGAGSGRNDAPIGARDGQNPAAAFKVTTINQNIHGGVQIPAIVISTDAGQVSFIRPNQWMVQSDPSQKSIRLISQKTSALISVRITESSNATPQMKAETLRQEFQARFPDRKLIDEFPVSAFGGNGVGFDLKWQARNSAPQVARFAFVAFAGGHLECELTASTDDAPQAFQTLNQLLLSARRTPRGGKLEIQPVSPE